MKYGDLSPNEINILMQLSTTDDPSATMMQFIDIVSRNSQLLGKEQAQRKISEVLFNPQILVGYFNNDFSNLEKHLKDFNECIEKSIEGKEFKKAAFLLYLCEKMKCMAQNINGPNEQKLKGLIDALPTLESQFKGKTAWEWLQQAKNTSDERAVSVYLLDHVTEDEIQKADSSKIAQILRAWSMFLSPGGIDFASDLQSFVHAKMEKSILPKILERFKKEDLLEDAVLNELTESDPKTTWMTDADEGHPPTFPFTFISKEGHRVNVISGNIGNIRDLATPVALPEKICNNIRYETLFKAYRPQVAIVSQPPKQICSWQEGIHTFHLEYDAFEDRLTVFFEDKKGERYVYCPADAKGNSNLSKQLREGGIWRAVNSEGKLTDKALCFLKRPLEYVDKQMPYASDPFVLHLKISGDKIRKVTTGDGRKVCVDEQGLLKSAFPYIPEDDLLFISDEKGKKVRAKGSSFELVCNEEGGWSPSDKTNWKVHTCTEKIFVGDLGPNYADSVCVLSNKDNTQAEYRIFPKFVRRLPVVGDDKDKRLFTEKVPDGPFGPFSVSVHKNGVKSGSHSGFFYLAYLALAQGEYRKAVEWLDLAVKNGATEKNSVFLKSLLSELPNLPVATVRAQAAVIKFEMMLRKVLAEKYQFSEFGPSSSPEEIQKTFDRLAGFSKLYEEAKTKCGTVLAAEGLLLQPDEEKKLEQIHTYSFPNILGVTPKKPLPNTEALEVPSKVSQNLIGHLLVMAKPPPEDMGSEDVFTDLRQKGLSASMVLGNFWILWNTLSNSKGDRDIEDLMLLLGPIVPSGDASLDAAIDEGRTLLLSAAVRLQEGKKVEITSSHNEMFASRTQCLSSSKIGKWEKVGKIFVPHVVDLYRLARNADARSFFDHFQQGCESMFSSVLCKQDENKPIVLLSSEVAKDPFLEKEMTLEEVREKIDESKISLVAKQIYFSACDQFEQESVQDQKYTIASWSTMFAKKGIVDVLLYPSKFKSWSRELQSP